MTDPNLKPGWENTFCRGPQTKRSVTKGFLSGKNHDFQESTFLWVPFAGCTRVSIGLAGRKSGERNQNS